MDLACPPPAATFPAWAHPGSEQWGAAEEFSRRILESSPDCIKVLSLDGRLEFFSVGGLCAMEIDDFDRQLRGAEWLPFWAPEDRPRVRAAIADALAGGIGRFQAFCATARGTPKWWDVSVSAMRAPDGTPQRLLSISRDISEIKRVEHALRETAARCRALIESAPEKMWVGRADGSPEYFNAAWCRYTGRPAVSDGTSWVDVVHPEDRACLADSRAGALSSGQPYRAELRLLRAHDGAWRWHESSVSPLRDAAGAVTGWVGTSVDVDDKRRALDAAQAAQAALAHADARKNEFLATLAHELRNPLSPVLNAARLLQRREPLSDTGQRAVQMIERQARQMKRLIDDLLEISRITRGTIELRPEPLLLGVAIQNAVEAALPAFDAKEQRLRAVLPAEPVRLSADPVRLAQVLENLLSNASKYTHRGGNACVEASEDHGAVTIRVSDDGIGIDPNQLDAVFDLFVQAEPGVGEHQGGLGIGLAMVRRLVEMHGGTVHAESAGRSQGATFVLRLPKGAMV